MSDLKATVSSVALCAVFFMGGYFTLGPLQQPAQPGDKTPVQIDVETQNEELKIQIEMKDQQADYMGCIDKMQGIQGKVTEEQKKINDLNEKALRKLGLDPATHDVNPRTFYVMDKPAPTPPPAKKDPEKK